MVDRVKEDYPDVELHMYIDNAAMQLIREPKQFDVIVTNNIFEIYLFCCKHDNRLNRHASSASPAEGNFGLYEPIHGSAPDIAGKIANLMADIIRRYDVKVFIGPF